MGKEYHLLKCPVLTENNTKCIYKTATQDKVWQILLEIIRKGNQKTKFSFLMLIKDFLEIVLVFNNTQIVEKLKNITTKSMKEIVHHLESHPHNQMACTVGILAVTLTPKGTVKNLQVLCLSQ